MPISNAKPTTSSSLNDQLAKIADDLKTDEEKIQVEQELASIERGIQLIKNTAWSQGSTLIDTDAGRSMLQELMETLRRPIQEDQDMAAAGIGAGGPGVRPEWWWLIQFIPAEKLAYLTIRSVLSVKMNKISLGRKANAICLEIGNTIKMQIEFEAWARKTKDDQRENGGIDVAAMLLRTAKNMNARQWTSYRRKIEDIETLEWTKEQKLRIGAKLLDTLIIHGGGFFELEYVRFRGKTERQVFLTQACRLMVDQITGHVGINSPILRPMIVAPRPWYWSPSQKKYTGGYYQIQVDFIRGSIHRHTGDLNDPISQEALDAANNVGKVWWQINKPAFDLINEARQLPHSLFKNIPDPDPIELPGRKTDDQWADMTKVERSEWKYTLTKVHSQNARDESKRESALRKISIASELMASRFSRFTYPQKIDTRTRLYAIPPDLNPQGDNLSRGLIEFALSEPLGPRGLYWMAVKLCNMYGVDKLSFEEMQQWAKDHHDLIVDSALRPLDGERFWTTAEKELEFYATCVEWCDATALDNPELYLSHQPSHQDGSNNGLQLLSLLGRDPIGAQLTNCSSDPQRFDIYQNTADLLASKVSMDAAKGDPIAMTWAGNITRSTVKRACMTTPYGVTPRGIMDQLIEDGHTDDLEGPRMKNAAWLRDRLVVALDETIVASRPIMTYFQEVAKTLAKNDKPLVWKTPSGCTVQQSYWNINKTDVRTVMGSYYMWSQNPDGGLNARKQALGSAPNVIHSLDAALLHKVVNKLVDKGINSFATVHDSFAVHYRHTDELRDTIREVAYSMFRNDWLRDGFHRDVQSRTQVELPEPPETGSFDVREVLDAPYFFS